MIVVAEWICLGNDKPSMPVEVCGASVFAAQLRCRIPSETNMIGLPFKSNENTISPSIPQRLLFLLGN